MPLTYNQHQLGKELIDEGTDKLSDAIGGSLSAELGPLGVAIGKGLGWLAGYAGDEILSHIPYDATLGQMPVNMGLIPLKSPTGGIPLASLQNPSLAPLRPGLTALTAPLQPLTPAVTKGFNRNNTDPGPAVVVVDDDGKNHSKQAHPSSRRISNAAMPYNAQGFTLRRQR